MFLAVNTVRCNVIGNLHHTFWIIGIFIGYLVFGFLTYFGSFYASGQIFIVPNLPNIEPQILSSGHSAYIDEAS